MSNIVTYGNFTPDFLDALASRLAGKRVLEIYAGNGYLASQLQERGIFVIPTTLFSGHDGHSQAMYTTVEELEATCAVLRYRDECDILLVSWPTVSEAMLRAALAWNDTGRPILFIGEMFNHDLPGGGLAGCASDSFFHAISVLEPIPEYTPRNFLDRACLVKVRDDAMSSVLMGRL